MAPSEIAQMTAEDFYAYQNYRNKNFDNMFHPAIEPLEALSIITDIVLDGELIVDTIPNKQIWTLIIKNGRKTNGFNRWI